MTIVAGFTGFAGGILCADTQETVSGYAKREVEKIQVLSKRPDYEYNIGIAAAGDSGPYADALTREVLEAISAVHEFDLGAISNAAECRLTEFFGKHVWPRASQDRAPQIETVILIQAITHGRIALFHTSETAINYVHSERQCCLGVGGYLGDFILRRTLANAASMSHMLAVAAYMLKEVRENVDGCGKNSTIWWFDNEGNCKPFWGDRLDFLEGQVEEINQILAQIVAYMTDVDGIDSDLFSADPKRIATILHDARVKNLETFAKEKEQERRLEAFMKRTKKTASE